VIVFLPLAVSRETASGAGETMTNALDAREFQARLQRLDTQLHEVERWTDPAAQAQMRAIVQTILDLHAAGLERMLDRLDATVLDACAGDDVVAGMLLLHGLHPLDMEARVRQALEEVRPALRGHGGNVELLGVRDGIVRLRLEGNCHSCPSSAATMQQTIEEAICGKAPEVMSVEVEGMPEEALMVNNGQARFALPLL
jgi:Fe-S cluster biogenesis protein NfuA